MSESSSKLIVVNENDMNAIWLEATCLPLINRMTRKVLVGRLKDRRKLESGRFTRVDVNDVLKRMWRKYRKLARFVPIETQLGSRLNVQLACLTLSGFQVFLEKGIERNYAIELLADVTWKLYRQWGAVVFYYHTHLFNNKQ